MEIFIKKGTKYVRGISFFETTKRLGMALTIFQKHDFFFLQVKGSFPGLKMEISLHSVVFELYLET